MKPMMDDCIEKVTNFGIENKKTVRINQTNLHIKTAIVRRFDEIL